jgi:hypothetical protein
VLGYEARHIGTKVRCSACDRLLTVPKDPDAYRLSEPVEEPPPPRDRPIRQREDEEEERRSPRWREEEDDERRPRRRREDEDEERRPRRREEEIDDRRPRRRRERNSSDRRSFMAPIGSLIWTSGGAWVMVILACIGVAFIVMGNTENVLSGKAKEQARTVTLSDLIATGPGDNAHVIVTDLTPASNFVYTARIKAGESAAGKPWNAVYVPLLPLTPDLRGRVERGENVWPQMNASSIRVLMMSKKAKTQADLQRLFSAGHIQGTIINSISKLEPEAEKVLRQNYPTTDFTKVLILEEGRKPASKAWGVFLVLVGVGSLFVAASLFLVGLIFHERY